MKFLKSFDPVILNIVFGIMLGRATQHNVGSLVLMIVGSMGVYFNAYFWGMRRGVQAGILQSYEMLAQRTLDSMNSFLSQNRNDKF